MVTHYAEVLGCNLRHIVLASCLWKYAVLYNELTCLREGWTSIISLGNDWELACAPLPHLSHSLSLSFYLNNTGRVKIWHQEHYISPELSGLYLDKSENDTVCGHQLNCHTVLVSVHDRHRCVLGAQGTCFHLTISVVKILPLFHLNLDSLYSRLNGQITLNVYCQSAEELSRETL